MFTTERDERSSLVPYSLADERLDSWRLMKLVSSPRSTSNKAKFQTWRKSCRDIDCPHSMRLQQSFSFRSDSHPL